MRIMAFSPTHGVECTWHGVTFTELCRMIRMIVNASAPDSSSLVPNEYFLSGH